MFIYSIVGIDASSGCLRLVVEGVSVDSWMRKGDTTPSVADRWAKPTRKPSWDPPVDAPCRVTETDEAEVADAVGKSSVIQGTVGVTLVEPGCPVGMDTRLYAATLLFGMGHGAGHCIAPSGHRNSRRSADVHSRCGCFC